MASTRPEPEKVLSRSMALHNVEVIFPPQTVPPASRILTWYKAAQTVEMLRFGLRGVSYYTQTRAFSVINQVFIGITLLKIPNQERFTSINF